MRTATVSVNGTEHFLCYNLGVIRATAEKYGSMESVFDEMDSADEVAALDAAVWLVAQMMSAGKNYADYMGMSTAEPLTGAQLFDLCDLDDFAGLRNAIIRTVANGKERHVELADDDPGKNGETTRES